ncbi:MAG: FtsA protein [Patescibacteria group bacterium]|nr:FtsA protein [Patescibacteria group bacterium]
MIVGIDIGSAYLRAIGCILEEGKRTPTVVTTYKKRVEGVVRGTIIDPIEVSNALEDAVNALTEETGRRIAHTLVSLSATNLSSSQASGHTQVTKGNAEVSDLDVDNAIKDSHKGIPDVRNKTIVHTIPLRFKLDGNEVQGQILGTHGNKLEVKTMFVTYPTTMMESFKKVLDNAGLKVTDIVAGPIAESIPLLTKKQKTAGVVLLAIGAGTTSILVYENNVPLLLATIPIGGDDITKDIALGLKVSLQDAEDIKCSRLAVTSRRKLDEIIEARLEDLCEKINKELDKIHRKELLPAGIVVTGGSMYLPGLESVLRRELKLPITITTNELSKVTGDTLRDSAWARVYGLSFLAPKEDEREVISILFTSFIRSVKRFFSQFLP